MSNRIVDMRKALRNLESLRVIFWGGKARKKAISNYFRLFWAILAPWLLRATALLSLNVDPIFFLRPGAPREGQGTQGKARGPPGSHPWVPPGLQKRKNGIYI